MHIAHQRNRRRGIVTWIKDGETARGVHHNAYAMNFIGIRKTFSGGVAKQGALPLAPHQKCFDQVLHFYQHCTKSVSCK